MHDAADGGELLSVETVVPSRSVLTELARGFLLTREGAGRRAARFATTFLRERHAFGPPERESAPSPSGRGSVTFARRHLGLLPHGAVERPSAIP